MSVALRVVLDELVAPSRIDGDAAAASLTRELIAQAPAGCRVEAIVPAGADAAAIARDVPGLADVETATLPAGVLRRAWAAGLAPGPRGGVVHGTGLFAPLPRGGRGSSGEQSVVTVWDLSAWDAPERLPNAQVALERAMLRRAARTVDVLVAPTHAGAARLVELTRSRGRVRVIGGAPAAALRVPTDEIGRRRALSLPEGYIVTAAGSGLSHAVAAVHAARPTTNLVVVDAVGAAARTARAHAVAAGIDPALVHVLGTLEAADRAAVFAAAIVFVAEAAGPGYPWRALDALALGVPVVAVDDAVNREVLGEGALLVPDTAAAIADAVAAVTAGGADAARAAVRAADRGRAFAWSDAALRTWQLHADV